MIAPGAAAHLKDIHRNSTDTLRILILVFHVLPAIAHSIGMTWGCWVAGIRIELTIMDSNRNSGHVVVALGGVRRWLETVADFLDLFAEVLGTTISSWSFRDNRQFSDRTSYKARKC